MLLHIESFDHMGSDASLVSNKWRNSQSMTLSGSTPHGAGSSAFLSSTSNYLRLIIGNIYDNKATTYPNGVVGFHLRRDNIVSDYNYQFFSFINSSNTQIGGLSFSRDGHLQWERGTTPIYRTKHFRYNHVYSTNEWVYVEVRYSISSSIGAGTCYVNINGTTVLTLPGGTNTDGTSQGVCHGLQFLGSSSYIDNLYWASSTSGNVSSVINNGGGIFVRAMPPSGDLDDSWYAYPGAGGLGEDHSEVDESPPDEDSTYLYMATTDNKATFWYGYISDYDNYPYKCEAAGAVYGAQVVSRAKTDVGPTMQHMYNLADDGFSRWVLEPTDLGSTSTSYSYFISIVDAHPSNGSWTRANTAGMGWGIARGEYIWN